MNKRLLCLSFLVVWFGGDLACAAEDDDIYLCVQNGEVAKVKAILARNPKLANAKNEYNHTPLGLAAMTGNVEMMKLLLQSGAVMDVVAAAALGDSARLAAMLKEKPLLAKAPSEALHYAARRGDRKCVEVLLAHGADPNLDYGFANILGPYTPLSDAVVAQHYGITKLLLEHGAKTDVSAGKYYDRLLHYAIVNCEPRIAETILEHKANPNTTDHYGLTPLHLAAVIGDLEKVKLLLEFKADINAATKDEATALFFAMVGEHPNVCDELLQRRARLDIYSASGLVRRADVAALLQKEPSLINRKDRRLQRTPLFWAARAGDTALVQLLLDRGARVNVAAGRVFAPGNFITAPSVWSEKSETAKGETPLHVAATAGHTEVARLLLSRGAEVNTLDDSQQTPLGCACKKRRLAVVKLLLEHKADPNAQQRAGRMTPLHLAVSSPGIVGALLKAGANGQRAATDHGAPLFWAAYKGEWESARLMLAHGAKAEFHTACLLGRLEDLEKQLSDNPKLLNQRLPRGASFEETPLQLAARAGRVEVAKYLLDKGATLDPPDSSSPSPIHLAAMFGHRAVVELLLSRGVSPDGPNRDDELPVLFYATDSTQLEMVRLLLDRGAQVNKRVDFWGSVLHRVGLHRTAYGPPAPKINAEHIQREVGLARLLLDRGARLDALDWSGYTPLHRAAEAGQVELVKLFLERGAQVNARTPYDTTPLSCALGSRVYGKPGRDHQRVAELLRQSGGVE